MRISVESSGFADCMKKILPAVEVAKGKKGVTESSVCLMLSKQKLNEGYFGIAAAYDGKKQLFCAFCANELEMEEEKKEIYLAGKRLCDISVAMDNGKDVPMSIEVGKNCLIKKGGSQVQMPLGNRPVIIFPDDNWHLKTKVPTAELVELLSKGGRFYNPNMESSVADVCLCFDFLKRKLKVSSTDTHKLGMFGTDANLEQGEAFKKMLEKKKEADGNERGSFEAPPTFCLEENGLRIQIAGEQLKILPRFLDLKSEKTEICVFEKFLYFKSNADIALFVLKDVSVPERMYPFNGVINIIGKHSKEGAIYAMPKDILDALAVFDVANQGEEPHVYITKDETGMLCFSTKGATSKTLLPCEIKGTFHNVVLNSVILRQVVSSYEKEETMVIYIGMPEEAVVIKAKDKCEDFCIINKVDK